MVTNSNSFAGRLGLVATGIGTVISLVFLQLQCRDNQVIVDGLGTSNHIRTGILH